jgi:hypothetical protein
MPRQLSWNDRLCDTHLYTTSWPHNLWSVAHNLRPKQHCLDLNFTNDDLKEPLTTTLNGAVRLTAEGELRSPGLCLWTRCVSTKKQSLMGKRPLRGICGRGQFESLCSDKTHTYRHSTRLHWQRWQVPIDIASVVSSIH